MIKDYVIYLSGKVLPAAVGFLTTVLIIKNLSPLDYGYYTLFIATGSFLASLCFSWIRLTITRKYESIKYYFSRVDFIYLIKFPLFFLCLLMAALCGLLYSEVFNVTYLLIGILSSAYAAVLGGFDVLNEFNRVKSRALSYNLALLMKSSLMLFMVVLFSWLSFFYWTLYAGAIIATSLGALALIVTRQKNDEHLREKKLKGLTKKRTVRLFAGYGLPFSISISVSFFIFNSDKYIVSYYLGGEALGEYNAVAGLILIAVNIILSTFTLVWNPKLFRMRKKEGLEFALKEHRGKVYSYLLMSGALVVLAFIIGDMFFSIVGIENSYTNYWSIAIIAFGYASIYFKVYYSDTYLQLLNDTRGVVVNSAVLAVVSVILNFIFIRLYGPLGAALSYLVAAVLGVFLVKLRVRKCLKIR